MDRLGRGRVSTIKSNPNESKITTVCSLHTLNKRKKDEEATPISHVTNLKLGACSKVYIMQQTCPNTIHGYLNSPVAVTWGSKVYIMQQTCPNTIHGYLNSPVAVTWGSKVYITQQTCPNTIHGYLNSPGEVFLGQLQTLQERGVQPEVASVRRHDVTQTHVLGDERVGREPPVHQQRQNTLLHQRIGVTVFKVVCAHGCYFGSCRALKRT